MLHRLILRPVFFLQGTVRFPSRYGGIFLQGTVKFPSRYGKFSFKVRLNSPQATVVNNLTFRSLKGDFFSHLLPFNRAGEDTLIESFRERHLGVLALDFQFASRRFDELRRQGFV